MTDESGRFSAKGFKPGPWKVIVKTAQDRIIRCPDLIIPLRPLNPFPFDLVLPGGSVRGAFVCSGISEPMDWEPIRWNIKICDAKDWSSFSRINEKGKPRLEMKYLSDGTYRLEADVDGFEKYVYKKIVLEEDQVLDLGELLLQPCGVFDLTITDEKGNPLEDFDLYCNGKSQFASNKSAFGEGIFRCDKLPLNYVSLLFIAEGYEGQEITLHLEPGRIEKIRIVLSAF